ncbi:MAG TPA: TOBE domain-containing protein [Candidatus Limnocylindria bacterium]|jgi:molybdopterin-binding protein|nr:TOBE domain-containing protein [Candidatus Limnocylindria bacterium]
MNTRYRIGEVAAMLGVSADTVRRMIDRGELRARRTTGGQRLIAAADVATLLASRSRRDQHATPGESSARNRLAGVVTRVVKDRVAAQVEVQAGPYRLVSLLTREAVDELGLAPGVRVVAAVKATNVVIELPR